MSKVIIVELGVLLGSDTAVSNIRPQADIKFLFIQVDPGALRHRQSVCIVFYAPDKIYIPVIRCVVRKIQAGTFPFHVFKWQAKCKKCRSPERSISIEIGGHLLRTLCRNVADDLVLRSIEIKVCRHIAESKYVERVITQVDIMNKLL